MKRSTKKVLGLAASSVLIAGAFGPRALANTYTWLTTLSGGNQNWSNTANWSSSTVPGSGDIAFFNAAPPSNTVNLNANESLGALLDDLTGNLTIAQSNTLTLYGQTLTVPQYPGTSTITSGSVAYSGALTSSNVILAMESTATQTNTLTIADNLALENSQNVIITGANSNIAKGTPGGQTVVLSGSITNATSTPAQLTLLGGGNINYAGGNVILSGTNSFTGGMVLGETATNTLGTQGVEVYANTTSSLPSTGTIVVNEQSQLTLNASSGTFGTGTTLDLNGGGIGPGVSAGSSGALRTASNSNLTYAGIVNFGTGITDTLALGYTVITAAGGTGTLTLSNSVTGSGSLQKQGGGALVFAGNPSVTNPWTGGLQIGNGTVIVDSNSAIGTGNLGFFSQSSGDLAILNLHNATQSVGSLSSAFSATTGTNTQLLSLWGTTLTINQNSNAVFGYGAVSGLQSQIADGSGTQIGTVIYNGATGAQLSLTNPNTYSGGTTVTGGILNLANGTNGSATGTGSVTVRGGVLSTGGNVLEFQAAPGGSNPVITTGSIAGALIVDSGGTVSPGGAPGSGLVGTLNVPSITANAGSIFDFTLAGGEAATNSVINSTGAVTLDGSGHETVNVLGSQLAQGTYDLMNYSNVAGTGTQFSLGTTPNGRGRAYSLSTNGTDLVLTITATTTERYWSIGGGSPPVDGSGSWQNGTTSFYNSVPAPGTSQASAPYDSTSSADVVFGNGGNGGTVTITGPVTVGGALVFSTVNSAAPYTIASSGGANALTLVGGIAGSSSATVTAPIVLQGSQSFTAASGTTLTVSGGISQSSSGTTLTTGDLGTVVLGGTNTYTGGTVISNGTLQTTTSSLPSTGGANISSSAATLQFTQSSSGTYSGLISGSGAVTISGTGTVTLSNASNSYSGATNVESGVLSVNSPGALGTGGGGSAGGINFTGGTLQLTAPMTFTQSNPNQINFASGTTSTIDTDGNNVTMDEVLTGQGSITKTGGGDLTFTGFAAANVIGDLGVLQGTLTLNAPVPFGFSASPSGGTFAGDFILESGSMIARIQGGVFSGGGNIRIPNSGTGIVSQGATTISNPIVLNENSQPNFTVDIAANSANTLTITSAISGTVDPVQGVDFTGGAGIVYLTGQSTYTGGTYIDLGSAGEVQLDGVNGDLPSTSDVHLTAKATLDLYGNVTQTVGSLDSPGGLYDVANSTVNSILTNESPDPTTLATIIINGSKTTNFAGFITDGANSPTPGGALAIELGSNYTGTLWLNSQTNNNYAGGTILNGGTLILGSQGDQLLGASTAQGDTVVSPVTFGGGTLELSTSWVTSRPLTINPGTSTISEQTPGQSVNLTAPSIDWNGGALALTNTGASTLVQNGGTISVTHGSVLSVTSGLSLAVSGTTDPFTDATNTLNHVAIVNNGSFSVTGVNSSIAGITGTGALTVGDGSTTNTLQLAHQSGDSSQGSLTINGNSVLDITNNTMYIDFGTGSDPITTIAAYIKAGYNGGGWNGRGIVSTTAQTTTNGLLYGVGYADGKDHVVVGLTAGQIEVKYTLLGDANLDGLVNGSDFNILAANFNQSITGWDQGDFNYDGLVNASDFNVLAANFNQGVSGADVSGGDMAALDAFAVANGLSLPTSSVPEPATTGLLSAGVIGVLARRRRRSCE